ncbi:MAG: UDP-N-acetylmuramoyl-L-alanyl-D-glutamate--2,6-diaminopimelate ligase [Coxiellaceae bacterium]|jgi:UDP-N-acetylmuramoyl-L-alanyl-D-glutamate--2,6-diaminopimelate ligase|nr:UDP-N-acetylmuramoyl-L-alanyl-D-glutamate--2,6-diaminopimelate ligase [Coxiellaceae bacterium]
MITIKLSDLLLGIAEIDLKRDCWVNGLTLDSRTIKPGEIFMACVGAVIDGHNFILDAIKHGAVAIFCERDIPEIDSYKSIPIVVIVNLRCKIGLIAARFYGYPSKKLIMIGVTGTNGKTSITQYVATALTKVGISCGVVGTIGIGLPGKLAPTINTTPDPITLQRSLFELLAANVKVVVMEISSHSLVQGRTNGVDFDIVVFTNLTRDHLDYHGTMTDYGEAKKKIFSQHKLKCAIINADNEFGRNLIQEFRSLFKIYAYTITENTTVDVSVIKAQDIKISSTMISAQVVTPWGSGILQSELLGRFNFSNLLAVLAVLGVMQVDVRDSLIVISKLKAIKGRMQVFGGKCGQPKVVVDYAHTPDALEQVLLNLREYCSGALWCVFGCGGDRDRGKRSLMGSIAERLSDHIIITNDNPRTEDPQCIVDDILTGLSCALFVKIEFNREIAIAYAINHAQAGDLVLIAGKGHEDYQIIGKKKILFDDTAVVIRTLQSKNGDNLVY